MTVWRLEEPAPMCIAYLFYPVCSLDWGTVPPQHIHVPLLRAWWLSLYYFLYCYWYWLGYGGWGGNVLLPICCISIPWARFECWCLDLCMHTTILVHGRILSVCSWYFCNINGISLYHYYYLWNETIEIGFVNSIIIYYFEIGFVWRLVFKNIGLWVVKMCTIFSDNYVWLGTKRARYIVHILGSWLWR